MDLERLAALADDLKTEHALARATERAERKRLKSAKRSVRHAREAHVLLQSVAERVQRDVHDKVASVVSECLKAVYSDDPEGPYAFKFVFAKKRGGVEARPVFVRAGRELDPRDECSGGVKEVAAFALRLVALVMTRPAPRRLLVLDEPFGAVDATARPKLGPLLEKLAETLKVQFILVTHSEALRAGRVYRLSKKKNGGDVEDVSGGL